MKLIVVATLALVAAAVAAPAGAPVDPKNVQTLRSSFEQQPEGGYQFGYENDDGTKRDETGELKTVNDEENKPQTVVVVRGTYSYVGSDGKPHEVVYYADETGFHAESEDIPKAA